MIATYIGTLQHPPTLTRRSPFLIRVSTTGGRDPAALYSIEKGACPACRSSHEALRASWRKPNPGERPGGVLDVASFARPVPDEDEAYGHPRTVRLAL